MTSKALIGTVGMWVSMWILGSWAAALPGSAADWSSFRGDRGDGVAREEGLARAWPESGPSELWRRAVGDGYSGLTVVEDRVLTTEQVDGSQRVIALSAVDGKTLWSYDFGTGYEDASGFGDGARSTPAVDDGLVFAASADSVVVALELQTGQLAWRHDLKDGGKAQPPRFGFGASPKVFGELLVIEAGGPEGRSLVAYDKRTGETRWSVLDDPAGYATPVALELGGKTQLIFNRRSGLVGLDASTGQTLWQHPSALDTIVMPVVWGDRVFYSSAAMGNGGHQVRIVESSGDFSVEPVWSNARFRNHFSTAVRVDHTLYGFDNATLRAVDWQTGEAGWAHRGYGKGSLIAADDLLFVLGDRGTLALVAADPGEFRELGRVQAMEGRSWTAPSLADGRLFVRDHDELVAYDVRAADAAPRAETVSSAPEGSSETKTELPQTAAEALARYAEARGGAERWARVRSLELRGDYSAFSQTAPFVELHQRTAEGERFRLEFESLRGRATWGKDEAGLWWIFPLLGISEPQRLDTELGQVYAPQLERRARLEPLLLSEGLKVELGGAGRIGDRETFRLEVQAPDGLQETWHLDPQTWLEVAVDSTVRDFSQMQEPMTQRAFYSDFRAVDGLVLPHRVALEFGARLEEIEIEEVRVDPELDAGRFAGPKPEPAAEESSEPGEP